MTNAMRWARVLPLLLGLTLWSAAAEAAEAPCPIAGQTQMLLTRLYFGETVQGRPAVSEKDWQSFLAQTVTPRFPDGFTVYPASGQWQDRSTHAIIRENSRVIEIAAGDTPVLRSRIAEIARLYREKFQQQSVGIVTSMACAKF